MDLAILILLATIVVWNAAVFCMYAADKKRAAKNAWRISEAQLVGCALLAGGIGAALAMKFLRHKTQHIKFKICVPIAVVITLAAIGILVWFGFIR